MELIIKKNPWFIDILKKTELQDITLRNLYEFYLTNDNIFKILPIITSNSHISIRVLDWFVTNYSKKYTVIYELKGKDINGEKYFNVYLQYKCQLKSYKKKLFDPFCRKQRIAFHYDENKCVVTTIGQLNFFSWAITYGVLKYVEDNIQAITNDMITSNKMIIKKYKTTNNIELTSTNSSEGINKEHNLELETNQFNKIDENNNDNNNENNLGVVSKTKSTSTSIPTSTSTSTLTKIKKSAKTNLSSSSSSINELVNSTDSDKTRKKRQELSISANKTINIHNYSIVLSFD
jgi:hypothetical protein